VGALSTAYGIAPVMLNFALSAAILSWSARISLGMLMGATLFGFLIRMAIVLIAVLAVVHTSWVEVVPLGITIIVTTWLPSGRCATSRRRSPSPGSSPFRRWLLQLAEHPDPTSTDKESSTS
jgi:hypothetical protein